MAIRGSSGKTKPPAAATAGEAASAPPAAGGGDHPAAGKIAADDSSGQPVIGLALGSGSARGWAHIGVLRTLQEAGIQPAVVCGTSIGAFVGATYAAGELDKLEQWLGGLGWTDVLSFFDVGFSGGLLKGEKLMSFFGEQFADPDFASLQRPFACVATDLGSGREVWLREGSVTDAVRASIATPGLFSPVRRGNGFLVDGALVNPVPVSLCRALGADLVIAVELGSDVVSERRRRRRTGEQRNGDGLRRAQGAGGEAEATWAERLRKWLPGGAKDDGGAMPLPSVLDVLNTSLNIMQVRIARSRLAGEPADVLVTPRLAELGLLDYHRSAEAIAEGREAMRLMLPLLERLLAE
jgi:NTE family protein